jgi:surface polysaccharide O-acyltransferase-like enzyme
MTTESRTFLVYQLPFVKGTCTLGVILIHLTVGFSAVHPAGWTFASLLFLNSLGRFAVPLFVALSGFYLSLTPRNEHAVPFYRRTIRFLLVPYILYSLLYSAWNVLWHGHPWRLLSDLPLASASYHLWFGLLILQLYLLHPFLRRAYQACRHRGALVIAAFLLQIGWSILSITLLPAAWSALAAGLLPGSPHTAEAVRSGSSRLADLIFLSHLGDFVGGYYLLERSDEIRRIVKRPISALTGAIVWIAAAAGLAAYWGVPLSRGTGWNAMEHRYLMHFCLTPVLSMAALVPILSLSQHEDRLPRLVRRWLHSFGLYAYGVYYLHPLAISVLTLAYLYCIGPEPLQLAWFQAARYALVALTTLLAVKALARLPFGRYLT